MWCGLAETLSAERQTLHLGLSLVKSKDGGMIKKRTLRNLQDNRSSLKRTANPVGNKMLRLPKEMGALQPK